MQALVVIPFRQANLLLINHEGQPFVPMKPVVDGMGLDWKSQHVKLTTGRLSSTMVEITTVAEDGKQRQMTCLPLRKLPGWMMSIHPNKVRPELRDNIIAYQNECDDVLWSYWSECEAVNPRKSRKSKVLPNTSTLLPDAQAKEITERLNRLIFLFHPFSDPFADVHGIQRALRGLHPKLGMDEPSFRQVLKRP